MTLSQPEYNDSLAQINTKILADGENLPKVTLKDGSSVQTGTVATMLHNVKLYNGLNNDKQKKAIETELITAIPTLVKVGLFELFSPAEWIAGDNAGRKFIGEQARQYLKTEESF